VGFVVFNLFLFICVMFLNQCVLVFLCPFLFVSVFSVFLRFMATGYHLAIFNLFSSSCDTAKILPRKR
jgi:hypothetical protein